MDDPRAFFLRVARRSKSCATMRNASRPTASKPCSRARRRTARAMRNVLAIPTPQAPTVLPERSTPHPNCRASTALCGTIAKPDAPATSAPRSKMRRTPQQRAARRSGTGRSNGMTAPYAGRYTLTHKEAGRIKRRSHKRIRPRCGPLGAWVTTCHHGVPERRGRLLELSAGTDVRFLRKSAYPSMNLVIRRANLLEK